MRIFTCAFLTLLATPNLAQERAAALDAPLVTLGVDGRYGVLLDFDNDGFQDAVSWWWANAASAGRVRLKGWHNNGYGKLIQVWDTTVSTSFGSPLSEYSSLRVFPCNLDSDGLTDFYLVLNSYGEGAVRVLRSRGLAAPEVASVYSEGRGVSGISAETHAVVADFTGDGLADMALSFSDELRLLEYVPGETTLQLRSSTYPFGYSNIISGLLTLDANGDATPDLLTWRGNTIQLIEVQAGLPTATQTFTQGIVDHHMPAAGDLDGDGDQDLVIWDMSRYVVMRRVGPATWSAEPPVTGGPAEFLVDVDQDGDLDGVCCGGGGGESIYNTEPSTLRVSPNDGTGRFAPAIETSWLGSDHLAGIADLDHDGDQDVVSGRCILYARRPLTEVLHPPFGSSRTERSSGDIDGDSDPDFAVGLRSLERNLGEGLLSPHEASFPDAPFLTDFVGPGWPGDFDGDGDLDLVVRHEAGTTLLAQRLLLNRGGGAFADGGAAGPAGMDFNPLVPNGNTPEKSLAADADGDGDVDLITLGSSSPLQSRLWWNDGGGHFQAGPVFLGEQVREVADISGDGLPDLLSVTPTLGWRAGLGAGAFGSRFEFPETIDIQSRFALADLDSDGDLDFAVPRSGGYLWLYWNDGAGRFTSVQNFQASFPSTSPPRVWSTDVDLDGRLDLVAAPVGVWAPNGVWILERAADNQGYENSYFQIIYQHNGGNAFVKDIVLRDVDGDGDEDFLTDRLIRTGTQSMPVGGRRWQVGAGQAGSGGLVPTLGAEGPFRVGESAELRLSGGLGGASGVLTIFWVEDSPYARSASGTQSGTLERIVARIPFHLSGTPGEPGVGSWTLPFTVQPYSRFRTRRYMAEVYDSAAPGGVARSNHLLVSYGF